MKKTPPLPLESIIKRAELISSKFISLGFVTFSLIFLQTVENALKMVYSEHAIKLS